MAKSNKPGEDEGPAAPKKLTPSPESYARELDRAKRLVARAGSKWAHLTPAERAKEFHEWVSSLPRTPHIPDEALRRENLYD